MDLSDGSQWCEFQINGHAFECEAFEAADLLSEIDFAHRNDPHTCTACGSSVFPIEDVKPADLQCQACGAKSDKIRYSQDYLDDVVSLLRERYGAKRVSRGEAWKFYSTIASTVRELKKNVGSTAKSDIVSGSTAQPGPTT